MIHNEKKPNIFGNGSSVFFQACEDGSAKLLKNIQEHACDTQSALRWLVGESID